MVHGGQEALIKDALVFFVAAGLVVPVLRAAKLPAVVGFILAGVALGPSGFSAFSDQIPILEYVTISDPAAAPLAELGVLFLLFLLGLELSFEKLWALKRTVFGAGTVQAILSAVVIGYALFLFGLPATEAAIIGLALALSSTAIVMQLMVENKKAATPVGRSSLGVLLFQDILVAPILIF
ncbi:MAG: cation:proton antiporter, partial [Pseudomonadota bacterium]